MNTLLRVLGTTVPQGQVPRHLTDKSLIPNTAEKTPHGKH